jgi:hypothetical protein
VKILFLTVGRVFLRSGISAQKHATMPEFRPVTSAEIRESDRIT